MALHVVIIGGGIAGLSAAQAAREAAADAVITLVCGEQRLPYYRSWICRMIDRTEDESRLYLRSREWFDENNISLLFARVTYIDRDDHGQRLRFSDGSQMFFDRLILATGGRSSIPAVPGIGLPHVVSLRTIADVQRIAQLPGPAVVIGDGLLGVEIAWRLSLQGREVVLIGKEKHLLPKELDREGSLFFLRSAEESGISVALDAALLRIDPDRVLLTDGRAFPAGLVVIATGMQSVCDLAGPLGLATQHGILVNDSMETSVPGIYAAGDCAEWQGCVLGNWASAMRQGTVAGANSVGGALHFQPDRSQRSLNAMSTQLWLYGSTKDPDAQGDSRWDLLGGRFAKLFWKDGRCVGAELIGMEKGRLRVKKAVEQALPQSEAENLWAEIWQ